MTNLEIIWIIFIVTVILLFMADVRLSAARSHEISRKEAALLCSFWILIATLFGILTGYMLGSERMLEFFTAYVIEYSLSMDNMFVFIMIFAYFNVPKKYQPRILTWGILGAVVMRLILIFCGMGLIKAFGWIIYVFGAILIYTAVKMYRQKDEEIHPGKNPVLKLLARVMPLDATDSSGKFFTRKEVWYATPLFATLLVIETSDLIFAVDSIPAVLAISRETFIVYSSNVFAVVGLRSLYFLLAAIIDAFHLLKNGISIILFYVGAKMLVSDFIHIPAFLSLCVVMGILAISILLSILIKPAKDHISKLGE